MKTQNLPAILIFSMLLLICCVGAFLFKTRCPKCDDHVDSPLKHEITCTLPGCNYTYWDCQESHTHCPACQLVVDSLETTRKRGIRFEENHEVVCVVCNQKYFSCQDHLCSLPWDYTRSDPQSEEGDIQKLSPTGTLPRPLVEKNTVINR